MGDLRPLSDGRSPPNSRLSAKLGLDDFYRPEAGTMKRWGSFLLQSKRPTKGGGGK